MNLGSRDVLMADEAGVERAREMELKMFSMACFSVAGSTDFSGLDEDLSSDGVVRPRALNCAANRFVAFEPPSDADVAL